MRAVALPCSRLRPGSVVCSTSTTLLRERHGGRRDESGVLRGQRSILTRQLVAGSPKDPKIQSGLNDNVREQQLGCPVLRVGTALPCPPLRLQCPCRNSGVFSLALLVTILRLLYLKWLKLGKNFGVSSLQGDRQDFEEGIRTICGHGF